MTKAEVLSELRGEIDLLEHTPLTYGMERFLQALKIAAEVVEKNEK